jgi:deoxyribonuclease-4
MKKENILIGPAGTGGADLQNFKNIKKLGLDSVEVEFTYGVWMKKEQALKIAELNKNLNLRLSIHAPYFINLNSAEKQKVGASRSRILKSCEIGHYLSTGKEDKIPVVFHAGFYQKDSKEICYNHIKEEIIKIQEQIKENKWNVILCPETTGKASQFGDLDELLQLIKEVKCGICVDYAHLKARYNGVIDYDKIMEKLKPLCKDHLIHAHFSGIEYTAKGERRHLPTPPNEIKELFSYIQKYSIHTNIICEAPDPLGDALKMKKLLAN